MSFIPMEHYRYSLPRMLNFKKPKSKWLKYRFNQSKKYSIPVLERIKSEGPLSSSDFENHTGKKAGHGGIGNLPKLLLNIYSGKVIS